MCYQSIQLLLGFGTGKIAWEAPLGKPLLVAEGLDGIHGGGASCRVESEQKTDAQGNEHREKHRPERDSWFQGHDGGG